MGRIRSIHPDTCESETMAKLPASQERTFFRLLTHCDDAGRAQLNPRLLKAAIYPLIDEMTPDKVMKEIRALAAAGLLILYQVDGRDYLQVRSWTEYQHPKNPSKSKIPPLPQDYPRPTPGLPQDSTITSPSLTQDYPTGVGVGVGEGIGEGEGVGVGGSAEPSSGGSAPPVPEVVIFPCTGGSGRAGITQDQVDGWTRDFPGVNVPQQLRNMRAWLEANPTKRKTVRGIPAFVVRWLTKEQDQPRTNGTSRGAPQGGRSGSKTPDMDREYEAQILAAFPEASNA